MSKKLRFRLRTVKQISNIYDCIDYERLFLVYMSDEGEHYIDREIEAIPVLKYKIHKEYSIESMDDYLSECFNKCIAMGYDGLFVFRNHPNMISYLSEEERMSMCKLEDFLATKQSEFIFGSAVFSSNRITYRINRKVEGWKRRKRFGTLALS